MKRIIVSVVDNLCIGNEIHNDRSVTLYHLGSKVRIKLTVDQNFHVDIIYKEVKTYYIFNKNATTYVPDDLETKYLKQLEIYGPNLNTALFKIFRLLLIWNEIEKLFGCFAASYCKYHSIT